LGPVECTLEQHRVVKHVADIMINITTTWQPTYEKEAYPPPKIVNVMCLSRAGLMDQGPVCIFNVMQLGASVTVYIFGSVGDKGQLSLFFSRSRLVYTLPGPGPQIYQSFPVCLSFTR
jgi:hypothetical protein